MPGKNAAVLGMYPDYSSVENADQKKNMKTLKLCLTLLTLVAVGSLVGCSGASRKSRDVSESIRTALDQAASRMSR